MTPTPLPPSPPEITLNDLGELTALGLVALAARTARRALPLLQLPDDAVGRDRAAVFLAAVRAAENQANGMTPPDLDAAEAAVRVAYDAADAVADAAGFTGFSAAHAARAALMAARLGDTAADALFLEVLASSYGTARVLLNNCGMHAGPLVCAAIRADYDALVGLRLGRPGGAGRPVDPSEDGPLGPLWPHGAPGWYS